MVNLNKHYLFCQNFYRHTVYLFVLMFCCLVFTSKTWAEGISSEDPLTKQGGGKMYDAVRALSGYGGGVGANRNKVIGNLVDMPFLNWQGIMEEKLQDSAISQNAPITPSSGKKTSNFHTYVPKNQFQLMLRSKELEEIYNKEVKDGAASMIGATTWGLANSAVGQARFNAIMQSQAAVTNHYLSELTFIKQIEQYPHMKQEISNAYFSCVRAKMQKNKNNEGEKYSWFEAQEICMGDNAEIDDNSSKINGELFTFANVEDIDENSTDQKGEKICLTDYMLNQEGMDNGLGDDFKKSYQAYIGDILFKIDTSNDSNNEGKANAIRTIEYKFESPGSSSGGGSIGESEQSSQRVCIQENSSENKDKKPYELVKDSFIYRYELLVNTLADYCKKVRHKESSDGGNGDITGKQAIDARSAFENNENSKKFFETFTIVGFSIDGQTLDNLIDLIDNDASKENGNFNCQTISDLIDRNNNNIETTLKSVFDEGNNSDKGAFKIALYLISAGVTKATLLQTYEMLYYYLSRTTLGGFADSSSTYKLAVQQINNVMQSTLGCNLDNVSDVHNGLLKLLNDLIKVIMDHQNANQSIVDFANNVYGQGAGEFSLMGTNSGESL